MKLTKLMIVGLEVGALFGKVFFTSLAVMVICFITLGVSLGLTPYVIGYLSVHCLIGVLVTSFISKKQRDVYSFDSSGSFRY